MKERQKFEIMTVSLWLTNRRPFEPKMNKLRQTVEDDYCAKFRFIPIRAFRFIVLKYTPTYIHTYTHNWQTDRYISAALHYVVDVDNSSNVRKCVIKPRKNKLV